MGPPVNLFEFKSRGGVFISIDVRPEQAVTARQGFWRETLEPSRPIADARTFHQNREIEILEHGLDPGCSKRVRTRDGVDDLLMSPSALWPNIAQTVRASLLYSKEEGGRFL